MGSSSMICCLTSASGEEWSPRHSPSTRTQSPKQKVLRCIRRQELPSHFWEPHHGHQRAHISRMHFLTSPREPRQELCPLLYPSLSSMGCCSPPQRPGQLAAHGRIQTSPPVRGPLHWAARPLRRAVPRPLACPVHSRATTEATSRHNSTQPARPLDRPRAHTCN